MSLKLDVIGDSSLVVVVVVLVVVVPSPPVSGPRSAW